MPSQIAVELDDSVVDEQMAAARPLSNSHWNPTVCTVRLDNWRQSHSHESACENSSGTIPSTVSQQPEVGQLAAETGDKPVKMPLNSAPTGVTVSPL